eukprot:CAMPEP_0202468940 /NCGR_PEP_ID=MMETSP1360-20130828/76968_1 /ASSEMBLY_ACC=CAM_ASM_000848 /TAXON_ID=515479 /ORGANISM="Licmophora paradoxa, Strain CCMP2313" /LENGTH=58 /DNA_ID=CAMNT_0049094091 /DNA_START=77 /DNA_END=253 /DNA_ORIENTATION=-
MTGPECKPKRIPKSAVPGPNKTSSSATTVTTRSTHLRAKVAMTKAWSGRTSGTPQAAT